MTVPTLEQLLANIRRRPGMYLDDVSLAALSAFMGGFQAANLPPSSFENAFGSQFPSWLRARFRTEAFEQGWYEILRFYSRNDHDAFVLFFEMLDQFLVAKGLPPLPEPER